MNRTLGLALGIFALVGISASSSSERIGSATSTTVDGTTTTVDPSVTSTTDGTATTVVATTIAESSTTAAPPTSDDTPPPMPALRGGGIGSLDFGVADDDVLALLTSAYGGLRSDDSQTFTVNEGDLWTDEFGEGAFVTPIARTVCFVNTVCTYFGGTDAANLTFLGWEVNGEASPEPATIEGIMIGDLWSEHSDSMTRNPGGCYNYGYGTTIDGITVGMISNDVMFNSYVEDGGTWVDGDPDPSTVTIVYLSGGDRVFSLFEDC